MASVKKASWTDDDLRAAVSASDTMVEVVAKLGLKSPANRAVHRRILELDLDVSRFPTATRRPAITFARPVLTAAVAESMSYRQVLVSLGCRPIGSMYVQLRRQVERYGIDTSHFSGTTKGRVSPRRLTPDQVFVVLPEGQGRQKSHVLRRALVDSGVPYACVECENDGTWRSKPITLDVDHVNGEWRDNRKENLRFLCPNCHSQTETFRAMKRNRRVARQVSPIATGSTAR